MQYLEAGGQLPLDDAASQPQGASSSGGGSGTGVMGGLRGVMIIVRATVENAQLVAAHLRSACGRWGRCVDPALQFSACGRRQACPDGLGAMCVWSVLVCTLPGVLRCHLRRILKMAE